MENISIVGSGYVGLVTGVCFSEIGNNVTCIDTDEEKVVSLSKGIPTIYEHNLKELLTKNIAAKRLRFTTKLDKGIKNAKIIFLALPTPPDEDGTADLKYVLNIANKIGKLLNGYKTIVNKSTVPVGTTEKVKKEIEKHTQVKFDVVSNPEFLREGTAIDDFMKPDRVVIGTSSDKAKKTMEKLYLPLVRQGNPILFMDEKSAELTKYAANSFLATKITFMNEIANLCEKVGANVDLIRRGIGTDTRIGKSFLYAGIGYGGSCFPKDVQALMNSSKEYNYDFKILNAVTEINKQQKTKLLEKIKQYFNNNLKGKTIAVWGLAFKPYTDDIREAPALENINQLLRLGAKIQAFDPEAMANVKKIMGDKIKLCQDAYSALEGADALFIATEWHIFKQPDFNKVCKLLKNNVIFDGRNVFDVEEMKKLGIDYFSIGR